MDKRVMVVDDDPNIVEYLVSILTANGYDAIGVTDRTVALRSAAASPPDIIALDMEMPGEIGPILYRDMTSHPELKQVPFILMCGMAGLHHAVPNAVATLNKPFDPDKVVGIIRKTLGD